MVIRGNSRSNGRQLARYLTTKAENEQIRLLDVDGRDRGTQQELSDLLRDFDLSAELTKGSKGLYHAQINPAIGEDKLMGDDHWLQASDILAKQLGLEKQRRAIVLHSKKGRTHAHVVWERYDHDAGKMVSDSFSRLAQDRARHEMEHEFGHQPTPHRNAHRPELKASLLRLWNQTGTGAQFVHAARRNGYIITEGSGRSPYMVVDENGRSYSLNRQLKGVRLKDIRQRLRAESLMGEKDAIAFVRKNNSDARSGRDKSGSTGSFSGTATASFISTSPHTFMSNTNKSSNTSKSAGQSQSGPVRAGKSAAAPSPGQGAQTKAEFANSKESVTGQQQRGKDQFADNKQGITGQKQPDGPKPQQQQPQGAKEQFAANKGQATGQQPKPTTKEKFADNKKMTQKDDSKKQDEEKRREAFRQRMAAMREKQAKDRNRGPERD